MYCISFECNIGPIQNLYSSGFQRDARGTRQTDSKSDEFNGEQHEETENYTKVTNNQLIETTYNTFLNLLALVKIYLKVEMLWLSWIQMK